MVKHYGRKPRHVSIFQGISFRSKLLQGCIHIDRVPKSDDVDHEPQRSELIFLSLAVMLPQLASFAMEDGPRQAVPILAAVELRKRPPPFGLVIDGRECSLRSELS